MEKILNSFACDIEDIELIRGQGCHLFDREGKSYIDFEGGVWSLPLGHSHPRVNEVLRNQIEELVHMSYRYRNPIIERAAGAVLKAVSIASGKCSFLSSGSEAVELAVQITRRISGKPLLLTLSDSYLAAYGSSGTKKQDEWYCFDWKRDSINDIPFEQIGGFVFEPGNAGGLVRFPPVELVQALATKVQQSGGLVVVNEVTAGMGRTGAWFGFMHYGLNPDMVALGKGLGNGYPVSAVAMQNKIALELEGGAFKYAQSHQNDPLGCAVAAEVISIMEQNKLVERSQNLGAFFVKELQSLQKKHPNIKEIRGRGLMIVMEFQPDSDLSVISIYRKLLRAGHIIGYTASANVLRFYPPLVIEQEHISQMVKDLNDILSR